MASRFGDGSFVSGGCARDGTPTPSWQLQRLMPDRSPEASRLYGSEHVDACSVADIPRAACVSRGMGEEAFRFDGTVGRFSGHGVAARHAGPTRIRRSVLSTSLRQPWRPRKASAYMEPSLERCKDCDVNIHQIQLVTCCATSSGMVTPSAAAVVWLTIKSKVVGNSTGKSAGLAPFRMRSMK